MRNLRRSTGMSAACRAILCLVAAAALICAGCGGKDRCEGSGGTCQRTCSGPVSQASVFQQWCGSQQQLFCCMVDDAGDGSDAGDGG